MITRRTAPVLALLTATTLSGTALTSATTSQAHDQPSFSETTSRAALNLVFIVDGLRPDSISASQTPNLFRLRQQGVNFPNSHAVVPTVTRVNSAPVRPGAACCLTPPPRAAPAS